MELTEALLQFKQSLAKYSESPLLHIAEAAEKLKVTEKYLTDLASRGKIKAYKAGEHWFMEEKWLHDFRTGMKGLLDGEIGNHLSDDHHRKGWSRQLAPRRKKIAQPFFILAFQAAAAAVVLAFVGIGFSLLCLPLAQVSVNRAAIAGRFINATFSFYGLPGAYAGKILLSRPINDERLTHVFYRLAGKNPPGQVAGVYEVNIR